MDVLLLGAVEVRRGTAASPIAGHKLQALLALLALAAPNPVRAERLIDELWGDEPPANPANALQAQVSQLRRVVGRDVVVRQGPGYALAVDPGAVDATRMGQLVRQARAAADAGDQRGAAQAYQLAISLVRGPPLGELLDHPFAREAASRLEELELAAHEGLVDAELASGRHDEVVGELATLVADHPLRERFHAQLILALYRSGRQADALRAFQEARTVLVDELGIEPGPELRELEQAVLAHDPALAAPPRFDQTPVAGEAAAASPRRADDRPAATPDRPPVPSMVPVVGRDHELALLGVDLDDARAGRGRVALLAGEPGIGKTRLAEEIATAAAAEGALVAWGRCYDGRGAPAFWPWAQVAQTLVEQSPDQEVVAALGRHAGDIAQIVPDVKQLVDEVEAPPPLDPESARFRMCDALTRFIRSLSAGRPIVVVLDDLHWADPSSLQLLTFLAGALLDVPVLVLATHRNVGAAGGPELREALVELTRLPVVRRLDLEGLDRASVAAFIVAAGSQPSEEVLSAVHRRTQGNPFFVAEMLRLLAAGDGLEDVDAVRLAVPTGVRELIRQRVAQLPEDAADTVRAAAILGPAFDLALLAAALGTDGATALERLEPALEAGIVIAFADGPGRFRFSHGLVSETLVDDLAPVPRARLHQRVAEGLEARHGDDDGPHLALLAEHWFRAVPAAPPEKGIEASVRSAQWAQAHLGHGQAEDHLRVALDLLGGMPASRDRAERELAVLDQLSLLLIIRTGYAMPEVDPICARMRQLCLQIDDESLLVPALWRLCIHACIQMQLPTARALGEQLLGLGAGGAAPGPWMAGHMALGTVSTHEGNFREGRRHLDGALELLTAGVDDHLVGVVGETPAVWVHAFSSWNRWMLGDDDAAWAEVLDAVAAGRAAGLDSYGLTFATWFATLVAALRQDPATVVEIGDEGIGKALAGGYNMFVPYMSITRGWAIGADGDPEVGTADIAANAAGIRAAGSRMMRHVFPAFLADLLLREGRFADALAAADEGLVAVGVTGERWYEAELHRLRGVALAGLDPADPAAEDALQAAIDVAAAQGAAGLLARAQQTLASLPAG